MKASVIDLGFHSVKMITYDVTGDGELRPLGKKSYKAKLGEGLDETGFLGPGPIRRAISSLKAMKETAALESVKLVLPIATSAVREAANEGDFLKQVVDETGIRLRVLSGEEEALLSYAGAIGFSGSPDSIFFDLGGGSLELVASWNSRVESVLSLPLGALRLSYAFGRGDGTFSKQDFQKMEREVSELLPRKKELRVERGTRITGVGGVLRALARLDMALTGYPLAKLHNFSVSYEAVEGMSRMLLKMSRDELTELAAISNRSETIVAGTFVVKALMKATGASSLTLSTRGLRDGALAMFLQNPACFHEGTISRSQVDSYVVAAARAKKRYWPVLATFRKTGLVDARQCEVLAEAHRLAQCVTPTTDATAFFFSAMGVDSPLFHSDQLLATLAALSSRDPKSAQSFLEEYRRLLKRRDRKALQRLTAAFAIADLVDRCGAKVKLKRRSGSLVMSVSSGGANLPVALLNERAEALAEAFKVGTRLALEPRRPYADHPSLVGASSS